MSIHEIVVPDIGDSRDVEVSELLVTGGAVVAVGDALLVLESDKASVEVTTDVAGTIAAFMVDRFHPRWTFNSISGSCNPEVFK